MKAKKIISFVIMTALIFCSVMLVGCEKSLDDEIEKEVELELLAKIAVANAISGTSFTWQGFTCNKSKVSDDKYNVSGKVNVSSGSDKHSANYSGTVEKNSSGEFRANLKLDNFR